MNGDGRRGHNARAPSPSELDLNSNTEKKKGTEFKLVDRAFHVRSKIIETVVHLNFRTKV